MPTAEQLNKYAEVALSVGLGLTEGDRLVVTSPIDARDFTRQVAEAAYRAGASNVDVMWTDDEVTKARFSHGSEDAAGAISGYSRLANSTVETGDCLLYVLAEDPDLLAGQDQADVARFRKVNSEFIKPLRESTQSGRKRWAIVSAPTPQWASAVFSDVDEHEAVDLLWEAILRACRADVEDPVGAWERHVEHLAARSEYLSQKSFASLRYEGPGTDLVVGLPEGHRWVGGRTIGAEGIGFVPNLPTEEVFTTPDRLRAEGSVASTKPLNLFGSLVEELALSVSDGRVVQATAAKGQETIDQLLAIDEGSVRFGETALVPQSSSVAREGLIWQNMLYDENDACHIALGNGFPMALDGGVDMTEAELIDHGVNQSSVHVDFVVGSPDLNVYGVRPDGGEEALLAGGEWAFEV